MSNSKLLKSRYDSLRSDVNLLAEVQSSLMAKQQKLLARLERIEGYEILVGKAVEVLDQLKDAKERASKGVVEDLISYGLNVIFDEESKFSITLETKARAVYAYLGLGEEKQDLIKSKGGGYVDLISVLVVLTLLLKEKPVLRRFIVLDESFAEVGKDHLERVGEFLKFLVTKLDVTILLITHSLELLDAADIVYYVDKKSDGYTTFERKNDPKTSPNSDSDR